jgi:hypothetical protein
LGDLFVIFFESWYLKYGSVPLKVVHIFVFYSYQRPLSSPETLDYRNHEYYYLGLIHPSRHRFDEGEDPEKPHYQVRHYGVVVEPCRIQDFTP